MTCPNPTVLRCAHLGPVAPVATVLGLPLTIRDGAAA